MRVGLTGFLVALAATCVPAGAGAVVTDVRCGPIQPTEILRSASRQSIAALVSRKLPNEVKKFGDTGVFYNLTASETGTISGYFAAYNACPAKANGDCKPKTSNPRGVALLLRLVDYSPANKTGSAFLLCQKRASVNVGEINRIEIDTDGSSHRYRLNGAAICTASDATYPDGSVAIVGFSSSSKAANLKLDQLSVAPPARGAEPFERVSSDPTAAASVIAESGEPDLVAAN